MRIKLIFLIAFLVFASIADAQTDAAGYFISANYKRDSGDYAGAIKDYTKAIELGYTWPNIYNLRGMCRDNVKDYDGAIADYTKSIELQPFYVYYYNRGLSRFSKKDFDGAVTDFTKTAELSLKNADAYFQLGRAKSEKNDLDGAIKDYTTAIELNPKANAAFYNRGIVRAKKKDFNGAIADYTNAIELDPTDVEAYKSRAVAYRALGKASLAVADEKYTAAISAAKPYLDSAVEKAVAGNPDGAIADLTKAIELNPRDANGYLYRGAVRNAKKDYIAAVTDFSKAIEINPRLIDAYKSRAIAYRALGKIDLADANEKKAAELSK